ncbi:MAG: hypothetical protein ACR2PA_07485 [Hyphomicrobiaceae bacterium]
MTDQPHTFQIEPDILDRWKLIAEELGDDGAGLRLQLDDIEAGENSFDTLAKAAQAARIAERGTHGERKALAASLAVEIEQTALR